MTTCAPLPDLTVRLGSAVQHWFRTFLNSDPCRLVSRYAQLFASTGRAFVIENCHAGDCTEARPTRIIRIIHQNGARDVVCHRTPLLPAPLVPLVPSDPNTFGTFGAIGPQHLWCLWCQGSRPKTVSNPDSECTNLMHIMCIYDSFCINKF